MVNFYFLVFLTIFLINLINSEKIGTNPSTNQFLSYLDESIDFTGFTIDTANSTKQLPGVKCFWLEPNTLSVFDLKNLKRPFAQRYDYNFTTIFDQVFYNFCDDILQTCDSKSSQVAAFSKFNSSECVRLAGAQRSTNNWTLLNSSDAYGGFEITLNSGQTCIFDSTQNYTTSYIMKCDQSMKPGEVNLTQESSSSFMKIKCKNHLEFYSLEACPKLNFYAVWNFLQQYKIFFGAFLIGIGIFYTFLGAKLMTVTIFLTTCALSVTVVFILLFEFVNLKGANSSIIWVVLTIAVVAGLVLGYFVSKYNKFLIGMILGGFMGYILGLVLYNFALNHVKANPLLILWGCIIVCISICCLIAYYLVTFILILATTFCGAYALIRGISLYALGFPNEYYVIDLIRNQEWETLNNVLTPVVYAYMCGWIILCFVGIVVQIKTRDTDDSKNKEENENARYFLRK